MVMGHQATAVLGRAQRRLPQHTPAARRIRYAQHATVVSQLMHTLSEHPTLPPWLGRVLGHRK